MVISQTGIDLIKEYEGCYLTAYKCPAGVWTIGYGTTEPINGKPISQGMKITQQQANELLIKNLKTYEKAVNDYTKVPLNQNQYDALVSFVYNVGCNAYKTSTLLQLLNKDDYEGAANQLPRWNKAGGKVLAGLTKRREAEKKLFLTPVQQQEDKELLNALNKIVASGVKLDVTAWDNVDEINLKNVPALIVKLGIEALAKIGVISNTSTWTENKYTKNDVRSLIIKYAYTI